ncbi:MAG: methyltransferase domain-containing protein [Dehalococcoidales bacterium]
MNNDHNVIVLDREIIAHIYIKGIGIEVGALNLPLKVPKSTIVKYVDKFSTSQLRQRYPEIAPTEIVNVDIIDDGECLKTISDGSQDFVIANHFLEHCQNPIGATFNMLRVLRCDGILYMAIPDKRFTFDCDRPVTPTRHLLDDYKDGGANSKRMAFEEWVKYVDKIKDNTEAEWRVDRLIQIDYSIHYHAWTQIEILEIATILMKEINFQFDIELAYKNGIEMILVLKRK